MDKQLIVRIDKESKEKFSKIARMEGKSVSEKIREMVDEYIAENDMSAVVDSLWERISKKIHKSGFREEDIEGVIKKVRESK